MEKKTALITGASRGIGKAVACALAKAGYNVIINYNGNEEKAKEVLAICRSFGSDAMMIKADVTNFKTCEKMMKTVFDAYGRIDVLVNNSGITKDGLLMRMSEDDFSSVIDVNLKGCFHCIRHVSKIMMRQRSGVIINMASVIGLIGNIGQANYAASKAGVIALTKSAAKEFAVRGIRVNAIAPGFIATDMTNELSEDLKNNILKNIPLNRYGTTEDVAKLVLFLASEDSSYITGQIIHVDGGMVM